MEKMKTEREAMGLLDVYSDLNHLESFLVWEPKEKNQGRKE